VLVDTSSHLPEGAGNCWYLDLISRPRAVEFAVELKDLGRVYRLVETSG